MQSTSPITKRHHSHAFDDGNPLAERNTQWATALTAITMVVEIIGGWAYNSIIRFMLLKTVTAHHMRAKLPGTAWRALG